MHPSMEDTCFMSLGRGQPLLGICWCSWSYAVEWKLSA